MEITVTPSSGVLVVTTASLVALWVATMTIQTAVQSLAINHADGSVILYLPLSQPLPENAVTLNMAKYNTVPTNRRDDMGNIVTEMATKRTSIVFGELELVRRDIYIL